jgi:hypothetical protein
MGTVRDPPPFRRGKFVGQPIPRFEDRRFITGCGRYTDDIKLDEATAMALEGAAGLCAWRKFDFGYALSSTHSARLGMTMPRG